MSLKGIFKAYLGVNSVLGILMLTVPIIDILYREELSVWYLLFSSVLILIGVIASKIEAPPLTTIEAFTVAALGWISISVIGAVALHLTTGVPYLDSLFESVSGFTGTGFTVFKLEGMKHSIIFWRSLMQWAGELGFVVFAMVFIPYFYGVARNLYGVERPIKIETSFYRTALSLLVIYVILTAAGTVAYILAGMDPFESINHVMTTVATGGMSTYDDGYPRIFARVPMTVVPIFVFMVLGGMNLYDLYNLLSGRLRDLIKSVELKYYLATLVLIPSLAFVSYITVEGVRDINYALLASFFNTISGMTTTGFNIGSIAALSDTTKAIIIAGMFIGGMTFSTAGGIKTLRLLLAIKKFKQVAHSMITPPTAVKPISIMGRVVSDTDISQALLFIAIHLLAVFAGAVLISAYGYTFTDSLFETTSAASCVGLSSGIVSPLAPTGVKLTLMSLMLLGRIEYLHMFLLFSVIIGRRTMAMVR
jgi:trk system potassium uptake protein TrkH